MYCQGLNTALRLLLVEYDDCMGLENSAIHSHQMQSCLPSLLTPLACSSLPLATMNTGLCHLGWPTHKLTISVPRLPRLHTVLRDRTDFSYGYSTLETAFTSMPVLQRPNPKCPFVFGAVLSHCHGTPLKLFPCAFYSCKLSPMEVNYDIGKEEMLSINLALGEWSH